MFQERNVTFDYIAHGDMLTQRYVRHYKWYKPKPREERVYCKFNDEEIAYDFVIDIKGLEEFVGNYKSPKGTVQNAARNRSKIDRTSLKGLCTWNSKLEK